MKIAIVTDLHLDKEENLKRTVAALKKIIKINTEIGLDALLFLGDYSNSPGDIVFLSKTGVETVKEWVRGFSPFLPCVVVPGNHDTGTNGLFWSKKANADFCRTFLFEMAPQKIKDTVFLPFNSTAAAFAACGEISKSEFERMEEYLKPLPKTGKRIALLHHHPVVRGGKKIDEVGMELNNAEEFLSWCKKWEVDLVLHGHRHGDSGAVMKNGIQIYTGGSTGTTGRFSLLEIDLEGRIWTCLDAF